MKKRYLSLDILRGITIAFMCIVNNPGTWAKIFQPLRHAGWTGCTPTDMVYPFFIFCMGCAMASGETVEQACAAHGVDPDEFLDYLTAYLETV